MATTLVSVAALVVSLVVTLVQYAQWRTANQKVVIDLYDRRLQVYRQLEKAIAPVMREAEVDQAAFTAFCIGESDATFLFGDDIRQYLKSLRKALAWMLSFKDDAI